VNDGRVLVLNCGSSSVKYRLFADGTAVTGGLLQRIGEPGGDAGSHAEGLAHILSTVDIDGLAAVGHRVVHGGARFVAPVLIDDEVTGAIRDLVPLAPLHNPANLAGIEAARRLLPDVAHVAVFDTAFHATMPPASWCYAVDTEVAARYGVRRYGFHGTSHAYVSRRTAALLDRPQRTVNVITLHLGNGASACAVEGGRSVATSMGLTPLEGLVMGTRSGDLDPAAIFHLHRVGGMGLDDIDDLLNHHSGLRGLCGDNDMRAVLARRRDGDEAAARAFDIYCARIKSYVGSYAALLGRLDAITFTAGVGENSAEVRAAALSNLDIIGVEVDADRNVAPARDERRISADTSRVAVYVIPTDEEQEIATESLALAA
jgi:acetate kinase